jgi:hypothetical protein
MAPSKPTLVTEESINSVVSCGSHSKPDDVFASDSTGRTMRSTTTAKTAASKAKYENDRKSSLQKRSQEGNYFLYRIRNSKLMLITFSSHQYLPVLQEHAG